MTENAIIKTSQLGYASGLNLLYSYCPAVSLNYDIKLPKS